MKTTSDSNELISAERFALIMNSPICLTYSDFHKWINTNANTFSFISRSIRRSNENNLILQRDAERAFLVFQSFYLSFLHQNIDTVLFESIYDDYSDILRDYLSPMGPDYGDIELVTGSDHIGKLEQTMIHLRAHVGSIEFASPRFTDATILSPGEILNINPSKPLNVDLPLHCMSSAIWQRMDLQINSMTGIGMGPNYVLVKNLSTKTIP